MSKRMDKTAILQMNLQIEPAKADEYLAFEREMKAQGVAVEPGYRVVSPLGRINDARQKTETLALQASFRR